VTIKTLSELYGFERAPSNGTKKINVSGLRRLILKEAAMILFEEEEPPAEEATEQAGTWQAMNKDTNIADVPAGELWGQLVSGDESTPLYQAMASATGWAPGALKGAGGAEGLKKWAEGIGEEELTGRIGSVATAIGQATTPKFDMPALEGGDADEVADALNDQVGEFGVDFNSDFAGGVSGFKEWYDSIPPAAKEKYEAGTIPTPEDFKTGEEGEVPVEGHPEQAGADEQSAAPGTVLQQSVSRLANLLFEDMLPRHGRGPFPGAPEVDKDAEVDADKIKGPALAFLTKGKFDDSPGDTVPVTMDQGMSNGSMSPTQSNILAGKSLLFAFTKPAGVIDMGGAFVTSDGDILDGHHRWSGTLIATGGDADHTNVHIVAAPSDMVTQLLTVVANALGRQQKGPDPDEDIKESFRRSSDNLIIERWQRMAGLI